MEKLRNFFESKWAVIVAFVPVVNILYALFAFLLRGTDRFPFRMANFAIFCAAGMVLRFYPGWGWLIAYAAFVALALVDLKRIRQSDYVLAKSFTLRLAALSLPLILVLSVVLGSSLGLFDSSEEDAFFEQQTRAVLETVINNDPAAYKALEYRPSPFASLDGYTLVSLRQKLIEKNSLPEGEIGTLTLLQSSIDGPRACLTYKRAYDVVIGGALYRVKVEYTKTPDLSGFSAVDITKLT